MGQEPGQDLVDLVELSASWPYKAAIKVSARTVVSAEAQLGRYPCPNSCGS